MKRAALCRGCGRPLTLEDTRASNWVAHPACMKAVLKELRRARAFANEGIAVFVFPLAWVNPYEAWDTVPA